MQRAYRRRPDIVSSWPRPKWFFARFRSTLLEGDQNGREYLHQTRILHHQGLQPYCKDRWCSPEIARQESTGDGGRRGVSSSSLLVLRWSKGADSRSEASSMPTITPKGIQVQRCEGPWASPS